MDKEYKKISEEIYFYESEANEVEAFRKFITPHYQPCSKPIAMAVGALLPTERSVIKAYNLRQFGIPLENTRVAMANIDPMPPSMRSNPRCQYDFSAHSIEGDARLSYCYMSAFSAFDRLDRKFDFVYIRNPDLLGYADWDHIFARALEWTDPDGGVVATLIRNTDVRKYESLLQTLKGEFGIEPCFSGETGVESDPNSFCDNHQHTLGVFKPNK